MLKKWTVMGILGWLVFLVAGVALAQEHGAAAAGAAAAGGADTARALGFLAAGFGIAIASALGALAQARTASSALEGISRNPGAAEKMFVPMILGLVLIESLVIYTLVVSIIMLFTKL
jgi:F-type H+-transporting ATPase subunit c